MNLGAAAFWIFLAAIVVVVNWRNKHREAMRHETLRFLIDKNQTLDEALLTELLNPKPPETPEWLVHKPGYAYQGLRATGMVTIFAALGLGLIALWRGLMLGIQDGHVVEIGTGVALIFMLGAGLFVSSRFVTPPPSSEKKDKQDR
jgi:hypothetical protein